LIDGDGCLVRKMILLLACILVNVNQFNDQFIRGRGDGGVEAAQELHRQIRGHLSTLGDDVGRSRVMVRLYANLKGLSQTLAAVGLCRNEIRSMAPFACGFTRSQELFDFIDAGDKKEGVDFKINGTFAGVSRKYVLISHRNVPAVHR
jgi:hypothetical protein